MVRNSAFTQNSSATRKMGTLY
uniref:Uncharacterized protein n=1 Tax=Arundo donax TaxID=35708 RepID=A0A0A9AQ49_ARUDO